MEKQRLRRWLHTAFLLLLAVGLVGLAVCLGSRWRAAAQYEALQQQNQAVSSQPEPAATPSPTAEPLDIPIDFAAIQAENPDAYGWITIPGTLVDYPLMQHAEETDYYLDHTFEKTYGLPGSIYTRNDTAQDFSDPCTVVYGHNMKNDTMFGSLHEYEKADFFADAANRIIYTYTPDSIRAWTIFAATEYSDALIPAAYDFSDPEQKLAFVASLREWNGHFDESVPVDADSRLIVLSTCVTSRRADRRYLVVGVLTDEKTA